MAEELDIGYWQKQLEHAKGHFNDWIARGDKIVSRYRQDDVKTTPSGSRFNILWSNVQVLIPALYGRPAKPDVSRRNMDSDPVGRVASLMLERVLQYEVDQFPDFNAAMSGAVEDRLLPGRGTAWLRYDPIIEREELQVENEPEPQVDERIAEAHSPVDYVYWKDFQHSPARTWEEVSWVARWVYMSKDEGLQRFGEVFQNVSLREYSVDEGPVRTNSKSSMTEKARVAEIWHKPSLTVFWIADGYNQILDKREDPLGLEGFFPCPEPLWATMTSGTLIPVPDYAEYQDQAEELNQLTTRIGRLVKAIKATGVYNAEFKELARLLGEGSDNTLFAVTNWAALSEKGGLKGAVELLDISVQMSALGMLYNARESVKQTIYEICGISDILRGSTKAEETLGAQQLKANFGSLRMKKSQEAVARFAAEIFKLKAEIVCKFYPEELIVAMSGIQGIPDAAQPQIIPAALQLLKSSTARDFNIQVQSDSLAQIDEQAEKEDAAQALTAISGFLKEALPVAQQAPETLPMISELLLFTVRRFRAGRTMEFTIEQAMRQLSSSAQARAQNPPPSPEEVQAKIQAQSDQMRAQADIEAAKVKAELDAQVQIRKLQEEAKLEMMKADRTEGMRQREMELEKRIKAVELEEERWRARLDATTKIRLAKIGKTEAPEDDLAPTVDDSFDDTGAPKERPPVVVVSADPPKTKQIVIQRDSSGRMTGATVTESMGAA